MLTIAMLLAHATALAGSGRIAAGLNTSTAISPTEPTWFEQWSTAAAVGCGGLEGLWITGGHDYAGPRGEVKRTDDDVRWGLSARACATSGGGRTGAAGVVYGRQYGGAIYAAPTMTAGISAFAESGPGRSRYAAFAPFIEPALAFGLALPPGVSIEGGPYLTIAPPVLQAVRGERPTGMFVGQVGLELTFFAGAASPAAPWRRR